MDLFRVGAYSGEGTYLSVYTYSREIWYEDFKLLARRNITGLYHKHAWEVELQSNFQACQQNPGLASVIGDLIFFLVLEQCIPLVPAAMSQFLIRSVAYENQA